MFDDYQSKETEWRYHSRRGELLRNIEAAENHLHGLISDLEKLNASPPMYHLFNWSA